MTIPGTPEFVWLPPRFAARLRVSSVVLGVTLIVGQLLIFVIETAAHRGFTRLPGGTVAALDGVPTLALFGLSITLMTLRGCVRGDQLIIAKARARHRALGAWLGIVVFSGIAAVIVMLAIGDPRSALSGVGAAFFGLPPILLALMGYAVGVFFVRPSTATLRRFADRPVW